MITHRLIADQFNKPINFNQFDPLVIDSTKDKVATFSTPGGIITEALKYAFPLAGIILFVMILWGGFEILSSATSSKGQDAGKQRITAAVVGFFILFLSYWLIRLIGLIFGVSVI